MVIMIALSWLKAIRLIYLELLMLCIDEGKITNLSFCIVPTPDSAKRSGIYPGLKEIES